MTNDLAVSDLVKIAFGLVLMAVWVLVLYYKVAGADDLISFCKLGLTGLSVHYLTNYTPTPPAGTTVITATPQQGVPK
jgi:hypothetical protein